MKKTIKTISVVLCLCLAFQEVALAYPSIFTKNSTHQFKLPSIPKNVGRIESQFYPRNANVSKPTFYLIHDAHTNPSAQFNIAKLLDIIFLNNKSIQYVFLEAGSGDESLSFLRPYSDITKRLSVGRDMVRKGQLQGSEFFDITTNHAVSLWGVEDLSLYRKAISIYEEIVGRRVEAIEYLNQIQATLNILKPKIYSENLLEYDKLYNSYHSFVGASHNPFNSVPKSLSILAYVEKLLTKAKTLDLDMSEFSHLIFLLSLNEHEDSINFERVNFEYQKALSHMSTASNSSDKISSEESIGIIQNYLKELSEENRKNYSELENYLYLVSQTSHIDGSKVFDELNELELQIFSKLISSEDEQMMRRVDRVSQLLERLIDLTLSPDEFKELSSKTNSFNVVELTGSLNRFIMDLDSHHNRALVLKQDMDGLISLAKQFYELAYDRDLHFINASLSKMKSENQDSAVIVTGGYHAPHLKKLLESKDISYVSIAPQVLEETNRAQYEKILLKNMKKVSGYVAPRDFASLSDYAAAELRTGGVRLAELLGIKSPIVYARLHERMRRMAKLLVQPSRKLLNDSGRSTVAASRLDQEELIKVARRFFGEWQRPLLKAFSPDNSKLTISKIKTHLNQGGPQGVVTRSVAKGIIKKEAPYIQGVISKSESIVRREFRNWLASISASSSEEDKKFMDWLASKNVANEEDFVNVADQFYNSIWIDQLGSIEINHGLIQINYQGKDLNLYQINIRTSGPNLDFAVRILRPGVDAITQDASASGAIIDNYPKVKSIWLYPVRYRLIRNEFHSQIKQVMDELLAHREKHPTLKSVIKYLSRRGVLPSNWWANASDLDKMVMRDILTEMMYDRSLKEGPTRHEVELLNGSKKIIIPYVPGDSDYNQQLVQGIRADYPNAALFSDEQFLERSGVQSESVATLNDYSYKESLPSASDYIKLTEPFFNSFSDHGFWVRIIHRILDLIKVPKTFYPFAATHGLLRNSLAKGKNIAPSAYAIAALEAERVLNEGNLYTKSNWRRSAALEVMSTQRGVESNKDEIIVLVPIDQYSDAVWLAEHPSEASRRLDLSDDDYYAPNARQLEEATYDPSIGGLGFVDGGLQVVAKKVPSLKGPAATFYAKDIAAKIRARLGVRAQDILQDALADGGSKGPLHLLNNLNAERPDSVFPGEFELARSNPLVGKIIASTLIANVQSPFVLAESDDAVIRMKTPDGGEKIIRVVSVYPYDDNPEFRQVLTDRLERFEQQAELESRKFAAVKSEVLNMPSLKIPNLKELTKLPQLTTGISDADQFGEYKEARLRGDQTKSTILREAIDFGLIKNAIQILVNSLGGLGADTADSFLGKWGETLANDAGRQNTFQLMGQVKAGRGSIEDEFFHWAAIVSEAASRSEDEIAIVVAHSDAAGVKDFANSGVTDARELLLKGQDYEATTVIRRETSQLAVARDEREMTSVLWRAKASIAASRLAGGLLRAAFFLPLGISYAVLNRSKRTEYYEVDAMVRAALRQAAAADNKANRVHDFLAERIYFQWWDMQAEDDENSLELLLRREVKSDALNQALSDPAKKAIVFQILESYWPSVVQSSAFDLPGNAEPYQEKDGTWGIKVPIVGEDIGHGYGETSYIVIHGVEPGLASKVNIDKSLEQINQNGERIFATDLLMTWRFDHSKSLKKGGATDLRGTGIVNNGNRKFGVEHLPGLRGFVPFYLRLTRRDLSYAALLHNDTIRSLIRSLFGIRWLRVLRHNSWTEPLHRSMLRVDVAKSQNVNQLAAGMTSPTWIEYRNGYNELYYQTVASINELIQSQGLKPGETVHFYGTTEEAQVALSAVLNRKVAMNTVKRGDEWQVTKDLLQNERTMEQAEQLRGRARGLNDVIQHFERIAESTLPQWFVDAVAMLIPTGAVGDMPQELAILENILVQAKNQFNEELFPEGWKQALAEQIFVGNGDFYEIVTRLRHNRLITSEQAKLMGEQRIRINVLRKLWGIVGKSVRHANLGEVHGLKALQVKAQLYVDDDERHYVIPIQAYAYQDIDKERAALQQLKRGLWNLQTNNKIALSQNGLKENLQIRVETAYADNEVERFEILQLLEYMTEKDDVIGLPRDDEEIQAYGLRTFVWNPMVAESIAGIIQAFQDPQTLQSITDSNALDHVLSKVPGASQPIDWLRENAADLIVPDAESFSITLDLNQHLPAAAVSVASVAMNELVRISSGVVTQGESAGIYQLHLGREALPIMLEYLKHSGIYDQLDQAVLRTLESEVERTPMPAALERRWLNYYYGQNSTPLTQAVGAGIAKDILNKSMMSIRDDFTLPDTFTFVIPEVAYAVVDALEDQTEAQRVLENEIYLPTSAEIARNRTEKAAGLVWYMSENGTRFQAWLEPRGNSTWQIIRRVILAPLFYKSPSWLINIILQILHLPQKPGGIFHRKGHIERLLIGVYFDIRSRQRAPEGVNPEKWLAGLIQKSANPGSLFRSLARQLVMKGRNMAEYGDFSGSEVWPIWIDSIEEIWERNVDDMPLPKGWEAHEFDEGQTGIGVEFPTGGKVVLIPRNPINANEVGQSLNGIDPRNIRSDEKWSYDLPDKAEGYLDMSTAVHSHGVVPPGGSMSSYHKRILDESRVYRFVNSTYPLWSWLYNMNKYPWYMGGKVYYNRLNPNLQKFFAPFEYIASHRRDNALSSADLVGGKGMAWAKGTSLPPLHAMADRRQQNGGQYVAEDEGTFTLVRQIAMDVEPDETRYVVVDEKRLGLTAELITQYGLIDMRFLERNSLISATEMRRTKKEPIHRGQAALRHVVLNRFGALEKIPGASIVINMVEADHIAEQIWTTLKLRFKEHANKQLANAFELRMGSTSIPATSSGAILRNLNISSKLQRKLVGDDDEANTLGLQVLARLQDIHLSNQPDEESDTTRINLPGLDTTFVFHELPSNPGAADEMGEVKSQLDEINADPKAIAVIADGFEKTFNLQHHGAHPLLDTHGLPQDDLLSQAYMLQVIIPMISSISDKVEHMSFEMLAKFFNGLGTQITVLEPLTGVSNDFNPASTFASSLFTIGGYFEKLAGLSDGSIAKTTELDIPMNPVVRQGVMPILNQIVGIVGTDNWLTLEGGEGEPVRLRMHINADQIPEVLQYFRGQGWFDQTREMLSNFVGQMRPGKAYFGNAFLLLENARRRGELPPGLLRAANGAAKLETHFLDTEFDEVHVFIPRAFWPMAQLLQTGQGQAVLDDQKITRFSLLKKQSPTGNLHQPRGWGGKVRYDRMIDSMGGIILAASRMAKSDLLDGIPEAIKVLEKRNLKGQKVLVRVNANAPIQIEQRSRADWEKSDEKPWAVYGKVTDDARVREMETVVRFLLDKGAIPVLIGHSGRFNADITKDKRRSLAPVADKLAEIMGEEVHFHANSIDRNGLTLDPSEIDKPGIHMLENLRIATNAETHKDPTDFLRMKFAQELASLSDGIFILDAFGDSGSSGASIEEVALYADEAYAGPAMVEEFAKVDEEVRSKPLHAIVMGGEKLDKLDFALKLLKKLVKGQPFLFGSGPTAQLMEDGQLLSELQKADKAGSIKMALGFRGDDGKTFDIDDNTAGFYEKELGKLEKGQVVLMNGTMGLMEGKTEKEKTYREGTRRVWAKAKEMAGKGVKVVVVGGDGSKTARMYGLDSEENVIFFTGGGVLLKILADKELVGLRTLRLANKKPTLGQRLRYLIYRVFYFPYWRFKDEFFPEPVGLGINGGGQTAKPTIATGLFDHEAKVVVVNGISNDPNNESDDPKVNTRRFGELIEFDSTHGKSDILVTAIGYIKRNAKGRPMDTSWRTKTNNPRGELIKKEFNPEVIDAKKIPGDTKRWLRKVYSQLDQHKEMLRSVGIEPPAWLDQVQWLEFDVPGKKEPQRVLFYNERDRPHLLPFGALGAEHGIEASGTLLEKRLVLPFLDGTEETIVGAGLDGMTFSAPGKDDVQFMVAGVNLEDVLGLRGHISRSQKSLWKRLGEWAIDSIKGEGGAGRRVASMTSCSTNACSPIVHVLEQALGVSEGEFFMPHSKTASQPEYDGHLKKPNAHSGGIPSATGAAVSIGKVSYGAGPLGGEALRTYAPNGSIVTAEIMLNEPATAEDVENLLRRASEKGPLKGILNITTDESTGESSVGEMRGEFTSVVNVSQIQVIDEDGEGRGTFVKVVAFYDNAWGYAALLEEAAKAHARSLRTWRARGKSLWPIFPSKGKEKPKPEAVPEESGVVSEMKSALIHEQPDVVTKISRKRRIAITINPKDKEQQEELAVFVSRLLADPDPNIELAAIKGLPSDKASLEGFRDRILQLYKYHAIDKSIEIQSDNGVPQFVVVGDSEFAPIRVLTGDDREKLWEDESVDVVYDLTVNAEAESHVSKGAKAIVGNHRSFGGTVYGLESTDNFPTTGDFVRVMSSEALVAAPLLKGMNANGISQWDATFVRGPKASNPSLDHQPGRQVIGNMLVHSGKPIIKEMEASDDVNAMPKMTSHEIVADTPVGSMVHLTGRSKNKITLDEAKSMVRQNAESWGYMVVEGRSPSAHELVGVRKPVVVLDTMRVTNNRLVMVNVWYDPFSVQLSKMNDLASSPQIEPHSSPRRNKATTRGSPTVISEAKSTASIEGSSEITPETPEQPKSPITRMQNFVANTLRLLWITTLGIRAIDWILIKTGKSLPKPYEVTDKVDEPQTFKRVALAVAQKLRGKKGAVKTWNTMIENFVYGGKTFNLHSRQNGVPRARIAFVNQIIRSEDMSDIQGALLEVLDDEKIGISQAQSDLFQLAMTYGAKIVNHFQSGEEQMPREGTFAYKALMALQSASDTAKRWFLMPKAQTKVGRSAHRLILMMLTLESSIEIAKLFIRPSSFLSTEVRNTHDVVALFSKAETVAYSGDRRGATKIIDAAKELLESRLKVLKNQLSTNVFSGDKIETMSSMQQVAADVQTILLAVAFVAELIGPEKESEIIALIKEKIDLLPKSASVMEFMSDMNISLTVPTMTNAQYTPFVRTILSIVALRSSLQLGKSILDLSMPILKKDRVSGSRLAEKGYLDSIQDVSSMASKSLMLIRLGLKALSKFVSKNSSFEVTEEKVGAGDFRAIRSAIAKKLSDYDDPEQANEFQIRIENFFDLNGQQWDLTKPVSYYESDGKDALEALEQARKAFLNQELGRDDVGLMNGKKVRVATIVAKEVGAKGLAMRNKGLEEAMLQVGRNYLAQASNKMKKTKFFKSILSNESNASKILGLAGKSVDKLRRHVPKTNMGRTMDQITLQLEALNSILGVAKFGMINILKAEIRPSIEASTLLSRLGAAMNAEQLKDGELEGVASTAREYLSNQVRQLVDEISGMKMSRDDIVTTIDRVQVLIANIQIATDILNIVSEFLGQEKMNAIEEGVHSAAKKLLDAINLDKSENPIVVYLIKKIGKARFDETKEKIDAIYQSRLKKSEDDYNEIDLTLLTLIRVRISAKLASLALSKVDELRGDHFGSRIKRRLRGIVKLMVPPDGGIGAFDESFNPKNGGSGHKRLKPVLNYDPSQPDLMFRWRQSMRRMIFGGARRRDGLSAAILERGTFEYTNEEGENLVETDLIDRGIVAGIKPDLGTMDDPDSPGEEIPNPEGLEVLDETLERYGDRPGKKGAVFAKWRTVIRIGDNIPTDTNMRINARVLAKYAKKTQKYGMVPIVEPEIMLDGPHSIEDSYRASTRALEILFEELEKEGVYLPGLVLKTSMVLTGNQVSEEKRASHREVGFETLKAFIKTVPSEVGAIVFLSGGQKDQEVVENLNEVSLARMNRFDEAKQAVVKELRSEGKNNKANELLRKRAWRQAPWEISYSFGRGIQRPALDTWFGDVTEPGQVTDPIELDKNVSRARQVLQQTMADVKRARLGLLHADSEGVSRSPKGKTIIVANWKDQMTDDVETFLSEIEESLPEIDPNELEILIAPPHDDIIEVARLIRKAEQAKLIPRGVIRIAGQDAALPVNGPNTGSAPTAYKLRQKGASHVILGHSERRENGDTSAHVNTKIKQALQANLIPVVGIGETAAEKNENRTKDALYSQLDETFAGFSRSEMERMIIAYEPVYAIGTGIPATSHDALNARKIINEWLIQRYGSDVQGEVLILYGGSVTPDYVDEYVGLDDQFSGVLVGNASLDAKTFSAIVGVSQVQIHNGVLHPNSHSFVDAGVNGSDLTRTLEGYGLDFESAQIIGFDQSQNTDLALDNNVSVSALESAIVSAVSSAPMTALGPDAKDAGDLNSGHKLRDSLINFSKTTPNDVLVVIAEEGARDNVGNIMKVRTIYKNGNVTEFGSTSEEHQDFMKELESHRSKGKVRYAVVDAIDGTNLFASGKPGSISEIAIIEETDDIRTHLGHSELQIVDDEHNRVWGVSFTAPNSKGIKPFELPTKIMPKIAKKHAKAAGIKFYERRRMNDFVTNWINTSTVLAQWPRGEEDQKEGEGGGSHRHQEILDNIAQLKHDYPGVRTGEFTEGDAFFRLLSAIGDATGRHIVTFGRTGSAEGVAGGVPTWVLRYSQFVRKLVSTEKTKNGPEKAFEFSESEADQLKARGLTKKKANMILGKKQINGGNSVVAATSLTGLDPKIISGSFTDRYKPVQFIPDSEGDGGVIEANTLLINKRGSFLVRTRHYTDSLEGSIKALVGFDDLDPALQRGVRDRMINEFGVEIALAGSRLANSTTEEVNPVINKFEGDILLPASIKEAFSVGEQEALVRFVLRTISAQGQARLVGRPFAMRSNQGFAHILEILNTPDNENGLNLRIVGTAESIVINDPDEALAGLRDSEQRRSSDSDQEVKAFLKLVSIRNEMALEGHLNSMNNNLGIALPLNALANIEDDEEFKETFISWMVQIVQFKTPTKGSNMSFDKISFFLKADQMPIDRVEWMEEFLQTHEGLSFIQIGRPTELFKGIVYDVVDSRDNETTVDLRTLTLPINLEGVNKSTVLENVLKGVYSIAVLFDGEQVFDPQRQVIDFKQVQNIPDKIVEYFRSMLDDPDLIDEFDANILLRITRRSEWVLIQRFAFNLPKIKAHLAPTIRAFKRALRTLVFA